MRVAVPAFGDRVSPRFDCAASVLVVTVDDGEVADRQQLATIGWAPHERIKRLVELGVETVVCGGIDCWSAQLLQSAGVTIYARVAGPIEDVLAALADGRLQAQAAGHCSGPFGWPRLLGAEPAWPAGGPRPRGRWGGRRRGYRGGRGPEEP